MSSSSSSTNELLARFPGPVTLYPSRKRWLLVLVGCALFTAGGFWMIYDNKWMGWYVLICFGLGTLVAAVALLPGAGALTLDRDGFHAASLFRGYRARWRDVSRFAVAELPPADYKIVVFDDANAKGGKLAAANIAISGRTSGLPDTYGLSPDDIVDLMERWRGRALAQIPPT